MVECDSSKFLIIKTENKMKKAYGVLTEEYFVGYVYSETTGKAKSFALNSRLETDGYEFTDLLVYRCKALDSVFPKLSTNTLDPTEMMT
ncbi:hypothetical protein BSPWISOXPB_4354 [uncultured Gammaproteobacteria bacterium]|nr:hypothetical protein BSPWISOXPB_4354 [uncultured Gammaproteobacteria bacterium]